MLTALIIVSILAAILLVLVILHWRTIAEQDRELAELKLNNFDPPSPKPEDKPRQVTVYLDQAVAMRLARLRDAALAASRTKMNETVAEFEYSYALRTEAPLPDGWKNGRWSLDVGGPKGATVWIYEKASE